MITDSDLTSLIEQHRKGEFSIELTDAPPGTKVDYTLTRLDFDLGTIIYRSYFRLPESDANRQQYLERADKYFNSIMIPIFWHTLEWERGEYDDHPYMSLWNWCDAHKKKTFGHSIFYGWDGAVDCDPADLHLNFIQPWVRELDREQLKQVMKDHLERILFRFRDKITEYVLFNEVLGKTTADPQDYFSHALRYRTLEPYFRWAEDVAPGATYYTNENSIFWGDKTEQYVEMLSSLLDIGAEVGGIGIQGHMLTDTIPSNEQMWAVLEALSVFELPIRITEFGIQTPDEEQYAKDMERFYRLCLAHPAVVGVTRFGMWQPEMWNKLWPVQECHLWNEDWTMTPAGEVYQHLVTNEWVTRGSGEIDERGQLRFRGYFGTYRLDVGDSVYFVELTPGIKGATLALPPEGG